MKVRHSVPTTYNGQEFRSRFEARVAFWLDGLKIKWEYEPKSFILKNGVMIWPDFYLSELKTWLEVKGNLQSFDLINFENFVKENDPCEAVMITPEKCYFFSSWDVGGTNDELAMEKCDKCSKWFFVGLCGWYKCRYCEHYEDGHLDLFHDDILQQIKNTLKKMLGGEFYDT